MGLAGRIPGARAGARSAPNFCHLEVTMTLPENISADYTLRPSELASVLTVLVEARQPTIVTGPPGSAKSQIAQQV
ncbi:MAG: hypothetical protein OXN89_23845, partial [Bryobacterales bacterium]|nr:hypothetical protein [Bryobacterales bacterium]